MAVTDLTDSLPYWARQSAGAPGATGGPGAAPMGAGGAPGGPDGQAWLQYLSQMYGDQPASGRDDDAGRRQLGQHAFARRQNVSMVDLSSAANGPTNNGFTVPGHGDGPPGPVSAQAGGMNNFGNPAPVNGPGPGNVGPVPLNASIAQPPGGPMPARPATGMGMQPGALSSANLGAFNNMPAPSGGGSLPPERPCPPSPRRLWVRAPARRLRLRPSLAQWRAAARADKARHPTRASSASTGPTPTPQRAVEARKGPRSIWLACSAGASQRSILTLLQPTRSPCQARWPTRRSIGRQLGHRRQRQRRAELRRPDDANSPRGHAAQMGNIWQDSASPRLPNLLSSHCARRVTALNTQWSKTRRPSASARAPSRPSSRSSSPCRPTSDRRAGARPARAGSSPEGR